MVAEKMRYNFDAAGLRKMRKGNIKMDYKEIGY
jgi:hypothetical protein